MVGEMDKRTATIDKLFQNYAADTVRAGVLHVWLKSHPDAAKLLRLDSITREFVEVSNANDLHRVEVEVENARIASKIKDLESVFERLIDSQRKKKQGSVYTPDHIIDYLILECLKNTFFSPRIRILDPACGSGGFLLRAASLLETRFGIPPEQAVRNNLCGIDNDPAAIKHAKCLMELVLAQKRAFVPPNQMNLVCADTLLTDPTELLNLLACPSGAHLVVTNPPYVKLQTLEEEYRAVLGKKYTEYARFNFSLAILFLIAGRRLLAENGSLGFITQNNLFTSLAGERIRKHLQDERCIWRIIDFGHYRVFKSVLAYTCLVFIDQRKHETIEFDRVERKATLADLMRSTFDQVQVSSLKPKKWRLAKSVQQVNLKKIESMGVPLGEIAEVRVGFATLKDKVFFVNSDQKGYCMARHPDTGKEYIIEEGLTVPAVRVADIRNEADLDRVSRRVIFPYERTGGRFALLSETTLSESFPQAYKYLLDCRQLLEARDKGKRTYEAWYAWARTQGREAPGPKLLTKTFNRRPQFFLDPTDRLFCNGYAVFPPSRSLFQRGISIEALKHILESGVMHYYTKLTSFQIDGNFQCYQKNFIEKFGIPLLSEKEQHKIITMEPHQREALIAEIYGISQDDLLDVLGTSWRGSGIKT
jgi:type I restriction-modification system DNA methylase subunit